MLEFGPAPGLLFLRVAIIYKTLPDLEEKARLVELAVTVPGKRRRAILGPNRSVGQAGRRLRERPEARVPDTGTTDRSEII